MICQLLAQYAYKSKVHNFRAPERESYAPYFCKDPKTVAAMPPRSQPIDDPAPLSPDLVVLSRSLEAYPALVEHIHPRMHLVILDRAQDGIHQVTDVLAHLPSIRHIHCITGGTPGCLYLGSTPLSNASLPRHASTLHRWRSHLADDAKIVIYNTQVASNEAGRLLIDVLHHLTGAAIAAAITPHDSSLNHRPWEFDCTTQPFTPALAFPPSFLSRVNGTCATALEFTRC